MEQQIELGNPHMLESDLAYLAGLIDGEGTITLERSGNRRMNGHMGLQAKVLIANTNQVIIQHTVNLLRTLGINPHIKSQNPTLKNKRQKQCFWVTVAGLTKTAKLLKLVKPYLIGKVAQAQLILEFIDIRGNNILAKGKPYGLAEYRILDQIRALNFRGVSTTEDCELGRVAA